MAKLPSSLLFLVDNLARTRPVVTRSFDFFSNYRYNERFVSLYVMMMSSNLVLRMFLYSEYVSTKHGKLHQYMRV